MIVNLDAVDVRTS